MSGKTASFGKGDWIVHTYYGVGQIKNIETKIIDDQKTKYYRVETDNSTFFVPVDNVDSERIRSIASQYMLRKVKKILKAPPSDLPEDHNERKRFISECISDCSFDRTAELVRDLFARKSEHGLNDHETKIFDKLSTRLVTEWSITQGIDIEKATDQFDDALQEAIAKS